MASKKQKKSSELTPKRESFIEHYLANGFNGRAAARAAGYRGDDATLDATASRLLRIDKVASRVRARVEGVAATADEVLALLGDHLRGDMAAVAACVVDGELDWEMAQETGASRLIKRMKCTRRPVVRRWRGGEDDREEMIGFETTLDIEIHSSQEAAAKLIPVLGLRQKPADNQGPEDRRRAWAEEQLAKVMARLGVDRDAAVAWMRENTPTAAQWIN